MKKSSLILGSILLSFVLAGCQNPFVKAPSKPTEIKTPQAIENGASSGQPIGMANPASANCLEKGGKIEMRKNKNGEYGVCLFDDNRQCEEWSLLRGQCPLGGMKITGYENDAEIYCAITGGQVEGVGTETPMCKRIDGTYCNAQANLDGECPDPNNPTPNAGNVETDNSRPSINETIRLLFTEKYPKYAKTLLVNINQQTENHARGSIVFEASAPGGIFLAAKINNEWQIVHDGNGQIPCNLSKYGFPNEMLLDCAK